MRHFIFSKITSLIDWMLLISAILAVLYLSLEDLGVSIPSIRDNLLQLSFVGICLLIISTIWERRTILSEISSRLDDFIGDRINASLVLHARKQENPLLTNLENAKTIDLVGATLSTTIQHYRDEFIRLAKNGKKLRFIVVDPALYFDEREDKRLLNRSSLIQFVKLIHDTPSGSVDVRLLSRYPPNKLTIIRTDSPRRNTILVELFGYQASKNARPSFILYEDKDPEWSFYYYQMFETMWADAKSFTGLEPSKTDL